MLCNYKGKKKKKKGIVGFLQGNCLTNLLFQFQQASVPAGEDYFFLLGAAWRMLASTAAALAEFNMTFAIGCNKRRTVLSVCMLLKGR